MTGMKLRFSIRDLAWLALVVALAVGWWLHATKLNENHRLEIERVETFLTPQVR
jgi:hypothetical protein